MFERYRIGGYIYGWVDQIARQGVFVDKRVGKLICFELHQAVRFMKATNSTIDQAGQLHIIHFVNSLYEMGGLETLRLEQPSLFGSLKSVYVATCVSIFSRADRYQAALKAHNAEVSAWMEAH